MTGPGVVLVLPSLEVGGTEGQAVQLAAGLCRDGFPARIVTLRGGGPLAERARQAGVEVEVLGRRRGDPLTGPRLFRRLNELRPTAVHAFLFGFDGLAALAARLARVERVFGSRRELATWMKGRHRLADRVGSTLVDRIVCCARAVREHVRSSEPVDPERLVVIHNGVDALRFVTTPGRREAARAALGVAPGVTVVTHVANLAAEKAHEDLLDAVCGLGQRPVLVLLAGRGPREAQVRQGIEARGLQSRVRMLGAVEDVPRLLAASDVAVLSSRREGLPNVILEAMAAALPIVATRVGGIPEAVHDGRHGLLVPPAAPAALSAALGRLIDDPRRAASLGRAARVRAQACFPVERCVALHRRLYEGDWQGAADGSDG